MNKNYLLGAVFVVIFISGTALMIASDSIRIGDVLRSVSGLSPRVLSLAVLPFVIGVVVLGSYLRKKKEERMWKEALLRTRAKKQAQKEAAKQAEKTGQND